MLTMKIDARAVLVVPSQLTPPLWKECMSTQLRTLKVGSNIHRQASVERTLGMIQGSSRAARAKRWSGNTWFSSRAIDIPRANLKTVVMAGHSIGFQKLWTKIVSPRV